MGIKYTREDRRSREIKKKRYKCIETATKHREHFGHREANTQIIFLQKRRTYKLNQIQLHTELCVCVCGQCSQNWQTCSYKIEKEMYICVCLCFEVLQILFLFFSFSSHSICLFCVNRSSVQLKKRRVLLDLSVFVIIITITIIISYLTFNVTLFKVCFAALRSVDGFANFASFFSLIRAHSFYFALEVAHW